MVKFWRWEGGPPVRLNLFFEWPGCDMCQYVICDHDHMMDGRQVSSVGTISAHHDDYLLGSYLTLALMITWLSEARGFLQRYDCGETSRPLG